MKVWNRCGAGLGKDTHGDPVIQKYATMDEVVTVTQFTKRTEIWNSPPTLKYSTKAFERGHSHH